MKITVNNFKKFNPRNDLKSMPWLRLQNNFYDNEDFFDEDSNTTWLFVFLLCQCAQKVSESIEMSEKYLITKSKLKKSCFHAALNRLLAKGLILLEMNEVDLIRTDSCLTNERNEQNVTDEQNTAEPNTPCLMDEIVTLYNSNCVKHGMPKIKTLNVSRRKKLAKAIKEFKTLDDWNKIFSIAKEKGFIGKDGREFIPNWDYIFRNENYIKFFEEYELEENQKDKSNKQSIEAIQKDIMRSVSL